MDANRLWAKSKPKNEPPHPSMFLLQHLKDVHAAAERVLDATADDQLRALGLEPENYRDRFRRCVMLAAAVHDLGKANDHFQGMLLKNESRRNKPQGLRHEWVTVLLLQQLRDRLLSTAEGSETDFAIIEWAVAGHHPAHDHASPPRICPGCAGVEIEIYTSHPEFLDIMRWLKVDQKKFISAKRRLVGSSSVFTELVGWSKLASKRWEKLSATDKKLVAAVKNCLIAADVAGSALPRELPNDSNRWRWITESFAALPHPGEVQTVVDDRAKTFTERNIDRERFQAIVAASTASVVYVKAGCGSGKTQAAYMWAAELERRDRKSRRLFFCYPTTGTATEGFRDYLHEPDVRADLFHSRRDVDFEIILNTGPDTNDAERDAAIRLDSLDAWATPIVACTVDTVLGLVQNNKRGLFAWPALAQSAFVFDEIHAYDDRLFGALLRFLRDLPGLPALLMTASLPKPREEALRETLKLFRNIDLHPIPGPADLEELPRYHKATVENDDPIPLVAKTLAVKGKVLWVCNTVARVMDAADRAEKAGLTPLIYHSRFKYQDRVQRHKAVIDAFKCEGPALAICSQVAEMSLDLSADLLITDLATVPAIIQRLGRLNRKANYWCPTKPFVVINPNGSAPYIDNRGNPDPAGWPEQTAKWLAQLPASGISQRHLADAWEQTTEVWDYREQMKSAWLDGGPETGVKELREGTNGITVLMYQDLQYVKANRKHLGKFTLPMPTPKQPGWKEWDRERGILVAPTGTIDYDPIRGAKWNALRHH